MPVIIFAKIYCNRKPPIKMREINFEGGGNQARLYAPPQIHPKLEGLVCRLD